MRLIDLSGPDGNVFFLKGIARSWGKQLKEVNSDYDPEKISKAFKSCTSYNEVLDVFDSYFKDTIQYEFLNDPRIEIEV